MSITIALASLAVVLIVLLARRLVDFGGTTKGLDHATIVQALSRLGVVAHEEGHTLTLVVVGGAAMVLRYRARVSTRDVDAFFLTPPDRQQIRVWAAQVAHELTLPVEWLNDGAKGFMQGLTYGPLLLGAPGINVYQIGSEQLLAMKLSAWRSPVDRQDAAVVLAELAPQYPDKGELWSTVAPYATDIKAQYAFEELWERLHG